MSKVGTAAAVVVVGGLLLALWRAPDATPAPAVEPSALVTAAGPIHGMTVSCPTWGWEWGTDEMVATMEELRGLGVSWVAIHPYARIHNDGQVSFRGLDPANPPEWIARPIAEAHRLGMRIMIKPHLAYWGSRFDWRGSIDFEDPAELDRFFADYTRWIEAMAALSADADLFVVGTELDRLTEHDERWRGVIAAARGSYAGPMTFASNWDSYERVGFWDALDYVGVQGYFPVLGDGVSDPTDAALERGWADIAQRLRRYSEQQGRPIVLTELGYNRSSRAPWEPWAYRTGGEGADDVQRRCLRVALKAVDAEPAIQGAFLWKWFPGDVRRGDFLMSEPGPRGVIRDAWRRD